MQTSERGRKLIETFEGLRLTAYRDAVGVWTIGYGHTARSGEPLPYAGMTISWAKADAILASDLRPVEQGVLTAIKRPMAQGQFDAMVSLAFNIGLSAFRASSVARYFNRGQPILAANAFRLWDKAGGAVVGGLGARREAERSEFLFSGSADPSKISSADAIHKIDNPHGFLQRAAARIELEFAGAWA